MISPFTVDPRLDAEAVARLELPLCSVILRDEKRWPWIVLIPRRVGSEEPFDLLPQDQAQFWSEATQMAAALKAATRAEKINIAQFGNMCRQLHLHVVARTAGDPLWPGGVVGVDARQGYAENAVVPPWWSEFASKAPTS